MPTSRKRVKKPQEEQVLRSRNIVKSKLGKFVIITLSLGFVLAVVISFIYTLVQALNA